MSLGRSLKMKLRKPLIPVIRFLKYYAYQTPYVEGDGGTLHLGKRVRLANTLLNVESGSIFIGDDTIFGYNVMVLTGRHSFVNGQRSSLAMGKGSAMSGAGKEVPRAGFDIRIGSGCWIASGAIILGGVKIGNNVIVAANAVVSKDIPDFAVVAGVPARVVGDTRDRADLIPVES
jgi:acetyltransferase-like isoleucine patch superfamily enzyme